MKAETVIYGAGRQGLIVLETLHAIGKTQVIGFLDDDPAKHGTTLSGLPVLGGMEWGQINSKRDLGAIVAIGNSDVRVSLGNKLRRAGYELINVVHPSATLMSGVSMGTGNLVCAGAILVKGTQLEDDTVVNTGSILEHDTLLCTGAEIASGVSTAGCVTVGEYAFIGVGAILGPNVTIGERSVVGAGSLVLSDIPANVIAYGAPARVVREISGPIDWNEILA